VSAQSDAAAGLAGGAGYVLVKVFGWISIASLSQAFLLGAASAAGGFLLKKTGDFIYKKIIKTIILKLKKLKK